MWPHVVDDCGISLGPNSVESHPTRFDAVTRFGSEDALSHGRWTVGRDVIDGDLPNRETIGQHIVRSRSSEW